MARAGESGRVDGDWEVERGQEGRVRKLRGTRGAGRDRGCCSVEKRKGKPGEASREASMKKAGLGEQTSHFLWCTLLLQSPGFYLKANHYQRHIGIYYFNVVSKIRCRLSNYKAVNVCSFLKIYALAMSCFIAHGV